LGDPDELPDTQQIIDETEDNQPVFSPHNASCEKSSAKGPSDLGLEGSFRFEKTIFAIVTFSTFTFLKFSPTDIV
jgi:hypothetical protein